MAMVVTPPPSCLRPPPDPPPFFFLDLMPHVSSSLKMMVTALPSLSQPMSPQSPPPNKRLPVETLFPVKPPEPPDPPDASASFAPFRIFVTSARSPPQDTHIINLMVNFSLMSSKDDVALVVTGDSVFAYSCSFHVLYMSLPAPLAGLSPPEPPDESPFPVKPPEPPHPPEASVGPVPLRLFVTSARSSPKAAQALVLMSNISRVSSMLRDGDDALIVNGDTIQTNRVSFHVLYMFSPCRRSFPMVYRSGLCQRRNGLPNRSCSRFMVIHWLINIQVHLSSFLAGYPFSFEWDAMVEVWVIRALFGIVLMDFVSFSYTFISPGCFYSAIEFSLRNDSWFQICLTSSRVEYSMLVCRFLATGWFQILVITTALKPNAMFLAPSDDLLFVMFKGPTSWYHNSAILCVVEIRGHLCNEYAAWEAKSWYCDIGVIFSGENTIFLTNLREPRNHVLSAPQAVAFAVHRAVSCVVLSNVRFLAVLSELFGFTFVIYHFVLLFDVIFLSFISLARSVMNSIFGD